MAWRRAPDSEQCCQHHRQSVSYSGSGVKRYICLDCGHRWTTALRLDPYVNFLLEQAGAKL